MIFADTDRQRPAECRFPTDHIEAIDRRYSGVHPIMVGEWAASWLCFNALKYAREERQLNHYSLTDVPEIARAYAVATDDPYFVTRWV